jgi:hypothetical protein
LDGATTSYSSETEALSSTSDDAPSRGGGGGGGGGSSNSGDGNRGARRTTASSEAEDDVRPNGTHNEAEERSYAQKSVAAALRHTDSHSNTDSYSSALRSPHSVHYGGVGGGDKHKQPRTSHMRDFSKVLARIEFAVPFMCLIDFKGFRLIASSKLPLGPNTLVYGSADGGRSVHADDPLVNAKMAMLLGSLNLKEHLIARSKTKLYGPGDLEVHCGADKVRYVIDLARLMPPEAPNEELLRAKQARSIFYRLLRPEFVRSNDEPLCSDAFSGWDGDPQRAEHNAAVRRCTDRLYEQVVPAFARRIQKEWYDLRFDEACTAHEVLAVVKQATAHIRSDVLHSHGLNVRQLGAIRKHIETTQFAQLRAVILSACIARCVRHIVDEKARNVMQQLGTPSDSPFVQRVTKVRG